MEPEEPLPPDHETPEEGPPGGRLKTWWNNLSTPAKVVIFVFPLATLIMKDFTWKSRTTILGAWLLPLLLVAAIPTPVEPEPHTTKEASELLPDPMEGSDWTATIFDVEMENETEGFLSGAKLDQAYRGQTVYQTTLWVFDAKANATDHYELRSGLSSGSNTYSLEPTGVADQDELWTNGEDTLMLFQYANVVGVFVTENAPGEGDPEDDRDLLAVMVLNLKDRM